MYIYWGGTAVQHAENGGNCGAPFPQPLCRTGAKRKRPRRCLAVLCGKSVQPCGGQLSRAAHSFTPREGWVNRGVTGCLESPLVFSLIPQSESGVVGCEGARRENRCLFFITKTTSPAKATIASFAIVAGDSERGGRSVDEVPEQAGGGHPPHQCPSGLL